MGARTSTGEPSSRSLTAGVEKVLHDFGPVPDGFRPVASLIDVRGTLYGTTAEGGDDSDCVYNCGTVYSISKKGREKVLHSFSVYSDGANPFATLLDVKGTLYGTTENGIGNRGSNFGSGTVFRITTKGTEKVLYIFPYVGSDGVVPLAGLINVNGTLYGTTGLLAYDRGYGPYGTAFSFRKNGSLTTIHSFTSGSDGSGPFAPPLNVRGRLFGTTAGGGAYGEGTVFSMSLSGSHEKVLHSFGYGADGATPLAGLVDVKGTLYGTTSAGGANGNGTVFALTP